jgi:hypothetical protein
MNTHLFSWSAFGPATVSFCEARLGGAVAEPANAWSNMAYVAIALALRRLLGWSPTACVKCYVGLSCVSIALLAVVKTSGIPVFALHMATAISLEVVLWRHAAGDVRYGALQMVLGTFALASVLAQGSRP